MPGWSFIVFRSLGTIVMLFLLTRILGKKQISQLTFFEYITGITLGEVAGFMSTDIEGNYVYGMITLFIWFIVPFIAGLLVLRSKTIREILEGKGRVVIKHGKILEDNLKKERYTADELLEQLRNKNVFQVADVEYALLEANGDLSFLLKKENQPLTAAHLGIKTAPEQEPQTVVIDGNIMDESLAKIGLNRGWLQMELDKMGIPVENVFLGQVDSYGQLFVDLYDDQLKVPAPSSKAALFATLKKCAADLEMFALESRQKQVKMMYAQCAEGMENIISNMTPLLKR